MLVFAFVLAMLGRFSGKDHPKANRAFICISILNVLVGIASLINASLGQNREITLLKDLAKMQQTQLVVGNGLADKLREAQKVTEGISAELTHNTKTVGKVLHETERALQPLGSLSLIYELKLPGNNSEVTTAISRFESATADQKIDASLERPDPRVYLLRPAPKGLGFVFFPNSPLYPKPDTALGLIVRSVSVELQFHERHFPPSQYISASRPSPDLRIEFRDQFGSKWMHVQTGALYFGLRSTVPKNEWRSTGVILSVEDLIRAQAVAHPIFAVPPVAESQTYGMSQELLVSAQKLWENVSLQSAILDTGDGRLWSLDPSSSTTVKPYGVPVFVGQFHMLIKPLE
jgi:hypothetical protein